MKYLLDSHTLLWAAFRRDLLSAHALHILTNPACEMIVSAASAWEITTKYRLGKLNFARVLAQNFIPQITSVGYRLLPISVEHAVRAGQLSGSHKDPFDRMLAAQAIHENLPLLSNDSQFDVFGVRREW
ncbi:MAG: type II toxin-antitoxin system VapC family toxin [Terracidiphilus sp.]|jgi:PIN domain nuclease of toxin-antitoxin system